MNADDWKKAQTALTSMFGAVTLKVDDYEVALMLQRISTYKNAIVVYVGGKFNYEWLEKDCEERRRFCCRRERSLMSAKQKAAWNKMSKKSLKLLARQYKLGLDKKYEFFLPYWTSFGALKAHLIKHNASIELISIT